MKRKVNRVGTSTLTVSLPSKWAKQHDIKPGDELELEEEGHNLLLRIDDIRHERVLDLGLPSADDFMTRLVCGPYLKGYKSITYHYSDPQVYARVLGSLKHTLGFEIVDQRDGACTIAEVSSGSEDNFEKIIIRLFNVLRTFASEAQRAIKEGHERYDDVLEIEYTCDRLSLYCRRLINRDVVSGKTYDNTAMYHVACLAEQVGDELRQIIEHFKETKRDDFRYDSRLDTLFSGVQGSIDYTMKKITNYLEGLDYRKQIGYASEQRKYRSEANKMRGAFASFAGDNLIVFHHLLNAIEIIQHMSEELF
ncbi:AbrB/MazE/SpoVT family DNA-binding domain-containing protein [Candidatus Woesearchaeota archaeon]|nr:AbrB/MazE/SpoVT family DNA-binding domain-containing protein [Candidatus Woesearchaeota archaeon]